MTDKSEPAFPSGDWEGYKPVSGLTKREYIAVEMADSLLQSYLSKILNIAFFHDSKDLSSEYLLNTITENKTLRKKIRDAAYLMADTMLEKE